MEAVENVEPQGSAPGPVVSETPAAPVEAPASPEARDALITDELSAVWDKQQTNGAEKGPDGRFVSKAGTTDSADQPQTETIEPATPAIDPPQSWSAEARANWAKLPPDVQTYIAQRESEAHKAITSYGEKLKVYEPLEGVLAQHRADIQRRGMTEAQAVAALLEAQRQFDTDPLSAATRILLGYGIDLRPLLSGDPNAQPSLPDPRVMTLEQELNQLKQHLSERQRQEEAQRFSSVEAQVTEFSKDKPYFMEVERELLGLLPVIQEANPNAPITDVLSKAYDAAIHANPSIRERILLDQRKAEETKRAEEAAKRAEEAKRSGKVNVRSGTAHTTPKTMDEDLEEMGRRLYGT